MTTPASTAAAEAPWWFEDPEVYAKFVDKLKADTAAEAAGTPTPAPAAPSVDVGHQDSMTALVHELVTGLVGKSRSEPVAGAAATAAPVVAAAAAVAKPAISAWEAWKRKNQGLD